MIKTALAVIGGLALIEWAAGRGRAAYKAQVPIDQVFKHPFTSVADLRRQTTPASTATSMRPVASTRPAASTMSVRTPAAAPQSSRNSGGNGGPYMRVL